jgi:glycosyltransferase involved in cell wall biosynthesis
VVPNFLRPGAVASGVRAARPAWLPQGDYVLYVGELGVNKGVDVLLRAYERLVDPPPLVLIGTPSPTMSPAARANVIVKHNVAHDVVMNAWLGATVGVVPSVWGEPCPTTALEAAASGTPLVASRIGGLPEIVADGGTGLLVAPGNVGELSAALQRLLGDGELSRALGATAERRAERFGVDAVVERLESIYWTRTTRAGNRTLVAGAYAR